MIMRRLNLSQNHGAQAQWRERLDCAITMKSVVVRSAALAAKPLSTANASPSFGVCRKASCNDVSPRIYWLKLLQARNVNPLYIEIEKQGYAAVEFAAT